MVGVGGAVALAAPLLFRKDLGSLRPGNAQAEEWLTRQPLGVLIQVEAKKRRNVAFNAKFWAMLTIIADNVEGLTPELLCEVVKLRTGHVDVVKTKRGVVEIPRSISFAAMSENDFSAFYDRAVAFILSDILPGLNKDELNAEVLRVMEGR